MVRSAVPAAAVTIGLVRSAVAVAHTGCTSVQAV